MKKSDKIKVGISVGDLNGIGVEVILKTFSDSRMLDFCTPIIFASSKAISFHKNKLNLNVALNGISDLNQIVNHKINLYNIWKEEVDINFGKEDKTIGEYAFLSLKEAVKALKNNEIDVLVTAPINKNTIQSDDFNFKGHTEYLESQLTGEALMILMTDDLRIGLITGHIPIKEVASSINKDLISKKVYNMHASLKQDFRIDKPKIAVLGLNPHCGDNGVIGEEDDKIIRPLMKKFQDQKMLVYGPYASDSFFGTEAYKKFDGVLAMYHDQGLAPFKALSFGKGVNFTAGLDKIRTSPDHGTAFEIAGKGIADHSSFKEAVFKALEIFKNREEYKELTSNILKLKKNRDFKK
ncbi:MAG TPA: 4-hydroxythreonine-4-phosphate dehydrogenase PdxA [Flavobacteriia bacterium]|nr:4-hydroxythreonine-4-phosphate dehydrogenase PdxA [Flavobacteriia bacterium]